ncbi:hypothetical protein TRFO_19253 [Tritrichomonas foetus]|uniref:Surface antigen BspA-like n=1 Tax=Tritrichomonas foetus TaxID=1144522 RepID=A0A1J4KJS1_9EUKA|nr:hypothetical protein TRFO_19253 [Tritrichomonas foetus]|eukprot:OHT11362.1 hypothetical protein TRFO_19253 [Tritrichomonas foetus]
MHKQANNIVEVSRRFRTYKPSKKNTINKNRDSKPKYSGFRINKLILPKNVNTLRLTKLKQLTEIDLSNTTSLSQIRLSNTKIESITIPDSVKLLEDGCFENCFQLTTVTFSDKSQCHTFGKKAFYKCGITSIELPKSLKLIGSFCFHECNQLNMIDLSKCHAKLSQNSISSCPSLTTLKINKSISFAESSISDCENITTIEGSPIFNQTGLLIDQKSIYYCNKNTKSVTIPRNITLIPQKCFNFQNFRKITFENGSDCMVIGENAFSSSSVKKITIPDKTNIIQNYAFGNCTKLKSVILSNNLTRFGIFSFSLTNISSIEIPKSVEKIPIGCFYGCNNLKTVIFSKDNSIKKNWF